MSISRIYYKHKVFITTCVILLFTALVYVAVYGYEGFKKRGRGGGGFANIAKRMREQALARNRAIANAKKLAARKAENAKKKAAKKAADEAKKAARKASEEARKASEAARKAKADKLKNELITQKELKLIESAAKMAKDDAEKAKASRVLMEKNASMDPIKPAFDINTSNTKEGSAAGLKFSCSIYPA